MKEGEGPFLLLVNYLTEGWAVHRYKTEAELIDAVYEQQFTGHEIITAEERPLQLGYANIEEE